MKPNENSMCYHHRRSDFSSHQYYNQGNIYRHWTVRGASTDKVMIKTVIIIIHFAYRRNYKTAQSLYLRLSWQNDVSHNKTMVRSWAMTQWALVASLTVSYTSALIPPPFNRTQKATSRNDKKKASETQRCAVKLKRKRNEDKLIFPPSKFHMHIVALKNMNFLIFYGDMNLPIKSDASASFWSTGTLEILFPLYT